MVPKIVVTPPGPKSRELAELQRKYVPKAVYNVTPIFIAKSEGSILIDVDGNEYIDFATGISSLNIGHRHPEVIEAIREQLDRYLHLCFHVTPYEPYVRVAEKLANLAPGNFEKRVVLVNSGAEAVENAVKIARRYSGKPAIITFEYAFHGRTRLAMSLTGQIHPYKYGFGVLDPAIYRMPYAYCYRCSFGLEYPACNMRCIEYIRNTLSVHISPDEVAALIVEPVQGEGGFIVPPKEFIQGLRRICDENKILFIADEVQSGMGRTGKMFAIEHSNVVPDIITMAKTLGGGLPLAATICRADVVDVVQVGGLGGTFGGNPVSCVAALKTIEIVQRYLDNVPKLGSILMGRLKEMQEKYEVIGDVRGLGLMVGVELVKNRKTKEPARELRDKVLSECHRNGLIIMGAGAYHNVIRFLPPLNISEELLNKGLDIFENALKTSLTK
ncbi:MAG: 4-aminobutyrate--2-oxoglutarate transaminase [archaeon YNP-LCB-003-016]|uniref:4-aminobutyrate--2-oxoglutarate transaminase n=1 Tax=Candidatus Culexarchaeum yellowstonense TaxID=2928963 RepID=UPI0026F2B31E|nr:4-aminobutyrate--2-oxoglutarate transaminase [Candidatus Culexarchaeum yellowstonense]MCR6691457.1 4-aminobutyrate--2-oxoglutarate transaminase [Candidatus Culexarchaeum yellowstonense]